MGGRRRKWNVLEPSKMMEIWVLSEVLSTFEIQNQCFSAIEKLDRKPGNRSLSFAAFFFFLKNKPSYL